LTPARSGAITSSNLEDLFLIAGCCVAIATLIPVALFQTGMLRRLPDPPLSVFDSERITASSAAHPFGVPDGPVGIASFGTTLTLIFLAKRNRAARTLLGVKLTLDVSAAAVNAGRQVFQFGRLCSWCTAVAVSSGVMAYAGRQVIRDTWIEARSCLKGSMDQK
jgi:uncharacterized membrane protein